MADIVPPGVEAPDFTLPVTPDQKLSLHELRSRRVVLAFYPADWSPVCGDQLGLPKTELQAALTSGRYADRIRSDFLGGARSGVNGTPCFFINGVRHDGAWSFDELAAAIRAAQTRPPPNRPPDRPPLHGGYR